MHYARGAAFIPRGFPGVGKAQRCSATPHGTPLLPLSGPRDRSAPGRSRGRLSPAGRRHSRSLAGRDSPLA